MYINTNVYIYNIHIYIHICAGDIIQDRSFKRKPVEHVDVDKKETCFYTTISPRNKVFSINYKILEKCHGQMAKLEHTK